MANINIYGTLIRTTESDKIVRGSQVEGGYFPCEELPSWGDIGQLCYCTKDKKFYQYCAVTEEVDGVSTTINKWIDIRLDNVSNNLDKAVEEINEAIETEKNKIDVLIGNDKDKSVRTIANEELAEQLLSDDVEASFKTLQELAAWIENHPEDAATINATLQQLQRDLQSEVQLREAQINELNFSLKEEINRAKTEEDKIVQYVNKILFETELIIDSNEKKNTTY